MERILTYEDAVNLSREYDPARGPFTPRTPRGQTRLELENKGPARVGKTRRKRRG